MTDTANKTDNRLMWEIIDPIAYDAVEVHGVRDTGPLPDGSTCCEVDDDQPQFFSVYGHLREGGVECIGDFDTKELDRAAAMELNAKFGLTIWDYTTGKTEATR